jgi:hypothetical protein
MGMFSEIAAECNAKELLKILDAAKKTENKDIIEFCRQHVYPLYGSEVGEAWMKEPEEVALFWNKTPGRLSP